MFSNISRCPTLAGEWVGRNVRDHAEGLRNPSSMWQPSVWSDHRDPSPLASGSCRHGSWHTSGQWEERESLLTCFWERFNPLIKWEETVFCLCLIKIWCLETGFHLLVDETNLLKIAEQKQWENLILNGASELLNQSVLKLFCILTSYYMR